MRIKGLVNFMLSKKQITQIESIKKRPSKLISYKESEQFLELVETAIEENPLLYPAVREDLRTESLNFKAVKKNGIVLQYITQQTPELCLEAVRNNGLALEYVKKQTPEICLEALAQTGRAIVYVKELTEELLLKAIDRNTEVFEHIGVKSEDVIEKALKIDGMLLEFVRKPNIRAVHDSLQSKRAIDSIF